jgi:UDP-glucuronate decarboxylase
MTKILVTGGAGFIASCLIEKLVQDKGCYVVAVDNFLTGHPDRILPAETENYTFIKGDVNNYNDLSGIMLSWKFDYVFHYAAVVGVKRTLDNPVMVLEDITGIKNILQLAKNTGVKRIFFSSSSEVYGEPVEFPQNEQTTPLNSKLPYAIVKNIGEAFCRSYHQEYGLNFTLFRFFNTYGPKQSADFVMSRFIKAALKNEPITIYGDGLQTRTFCYVDDNIDACIKAFKENKFVNDVVNIGNDIEITILHLAQSIIKITGSSSPIVHLPALKEGDMTRRNPDIGKMKQLLQRELTPFETGIQHIIQSPVFQKINGIG